MGSINIFIIRIVIKHSTVGIKHQTWYGIVVRTKIHVLRIKCNFLMVLLKAVVCCCVAKVNTTYISHIVSRVFGLNFLRFFLWSAYALVVELAWSHVASSRFWRNTLVLCNFQWTLLLSFVCTQAVMSPCIQGWISDSSAYKYSERFPRSRKIFTKSASPKIFYQLYM